MKTISRLEVAVKVGDKGLETLGRISKHNQSIDIKVLS